MKLKEYIINSMDVYPETDQFGNIILSQFYTKPEDIHSYGFSIGAPPSNQIIFSASGSVTITSSGFSANSIQIGGTGSTGTWLIDATAVDLTTPVLKISPTIDYVNNTINFQEDNTTTDNDTE